MTTKIPPYNFTVDSKKYPNVPRIIDMAVNKLRMSRSQLVCQAIEEWYARRKEQYLKWNILNRKEEEVDYDDMLICFESLVPPITEPLSRFRYESNRDMYHLMREELLTHTGEVGHLLIDGVSKTRQRFEKGIDKRDDPDVLAVRWKEFPTNEEKLAAIRKAAQGRDEYNHMNLSGYIMRQMRNNQQLKTSEQRYEERIRELQEEIRKLSSSSLPLIEQQQQMKKKAELEQDIKAKEILQRSSSNNPTEDKEGESIESDIANQV
jgi:hypothetical protein